MTLAVTPTFADLPEAASRTIGGEVSLAARAVGGDAQAFGQLIDAHERAALAVAYACCGDADRAADAVQEACLLAWRKRQTLDEPTRFSGWLMSIVRRCAIDQVRRQPKREASGEHVPTVEGGPRPDGSIEQAEVGELIHQALHELDEPTRIAVTMRYYDNRPSRDIASALGCSAAAVDMRLKRARDALRDRLSRWFGD